MAPRAVAVSALSVSTLPRTSRALGQPDREPVGRHADPDVRPEEAPGRIKKISTMCDKGSGHVRVTRREARVAVCRGKAFPCSRRSRSARGYKRIREDKRLPSCGTGSEDAPKLRRTQCLDHTPPCHSTRRSIHATATSGDGMGPSGASIIGARDVCSLGRP